MAFIGTNVIALILGVAIIVTNLTIMRLGAASRRTGQRIAEIERAIEARPIIAACEVCGKLALARHMGVRQDTWPSQRIFLCREHIAGTRWDRRREPRPPTPTPSATPAATAAANA